MMPASAGKLRSNHFTSRASIAQGVRVVLDAERALLAAAFDKRNDPAKFLHGMARAVDTALITCWQSMTLPAGAALIAVGGYGRCELFPYSDVDVMILLAGPLSQAEERAIEELVGLFWDIGVELGHSVRTVDECLQETARDITVQTSVLESRIVCGDPATAQQLFTAFRAATDVQQFFRSKTLELAQRHGKYQDTPYALEPNCKESPGGLRDIQVILWIVRAAGLGGTWAEMAKRGLLTRTEAHQLRRDERFLKIIRIELHLLARRREDRLVFDVQNALAEKLGFAAVAPRRAGETLMQRYYWAAKTVTQLNVILMQNIETILFPTTAETVRINERFQSVGTLLDMVSEDVFEETPSAMLEAFLLMQQHSELRGMSARTLRAIWHGRTLVDGKFRKDPRNRQLFLSILQQPRGVVHELRRMNQLSVLGRYLPVFRRIVGQMQHDLFHAYTVDQHILMVVRNIRRFTMPEFAHEYPLCSKLMADFQTPWVLYIAALFHDIAKGRNGDHSTLGMVDARRFCKDHRISAEDTELIVFLVGQHLTMSRIAQKEDLSDPGVIEIFANIVESPRRLIALYLLTVADVRGTSPKVWNAWKAQLLEDLFYRGLRALGGAPASAHAELQARQQEAKAILSLYDFSQDATDRFWAQLDVAWFLRHDAKDIAWITRSFAMGVDSDEPRVKARLSHLGEGLQVVVYTPDRPDLLARICQFFDRNRFWILDARVHTTKRGKGPNYALDTFHISNHGHAHYRDVIARVQRDLALHLTGQAEMTPAPKGRLSRQSQNFPFSPTVELRPDERGQYFTLNVSAVDRTGLLYEILRVLAAHGVNVQTAKVTTLGERIEDFFLVDGGALSNARSQIQFESDLLRTLSA